MGNDVKIAEVIDVTELTPGTKINLSDFQVSASDANGVIRMVNMSVTVQDSKRSVYKIKPGAYRVTPEDGLIALDLPDEVFFDTETSTELMMHVSAFRNKLCVYQKYNRVPKRGVLLGGAPGVGKTILLQKYSRMVRDEDPKACILRIEGRVSYETVTQMFMGANSDDASFVVLVIEDIGGTGLNNKLDSVGADMLNFLSGGGDIFKIPTLILATTNYLPQLQQTLCNRPGRFDAVIDVRPPKDSEVKFLVEKTIGRQLTEHEFRALNRTGFTPAHSIEAVIRAELYDISIEVSVDQIKKQIEQAEKFFDTSKSMGFTDDD